jgi:hypothetical protein
VDFKKTIPFSGLKNPYKKIHETRKLESRGFMPRTPDKKCSSRIPSLDSNSDYCGKSPANKEDEILTGNREQGEGQLPWNYLETCLWLCGCVSWRKLEGGVAC